MFWTFLIISMFYFFQVVFTGDSNSLLYSRCSMPSPWKVVLKIPMLHVFPLKSGWRPNLNIYIQFMEVCCQILQPDIWVCLWLQVLSVRHAGSMKCVQKWKNLTKCLFQSCNVVLLPVKSLRESVQLLPSKFEYSGPMDLTQVILHMVFSWNLWRWLKILIAHNYKNMILQLSSFSSPSRKLGWWRGWRRGV